MMIIAVYSLKGGVGKTTTAVNLSYLFSQEYNTLICDLDAQGAASYYFRVQRKISQKTRVITRSKGDLQNAIKASDFENLAVLPADLSFRKLDVKLHEAKGSKKKLERALRSLGDEFDVIILDCPPSLNVLADNVFTAADTVLVPVVPTTLSVRTYEEVYQYFGRKSFDRKKLLPFFSMVEARKKLQRDTMLEFSLKHRRTLENFIRYQSEIEKMGTFRQPITAKKKSSKPAREYKKLYTEIKERLKLK